jgi:nucleotide-binding universal stress UspA family protein
MSRVRRILHDTDFSRASSAAVKRTVDIAKGNRAQLLLVDVTKGDLLRVACAAPDDPEFWQAPVWHFVAHGSVALRPTDSLVSAIRNMTESKLCSLGVIDRVCRVVAMASHNDLMVATAPEAT